MNTLLEHIGNILSSIIIWLVQISGNVLTNPIFIILVAVIILKILWDILCYQSLIWDKKHGINSRRIF